MPPHVRFEDTRDALTQLLAVRRGYGSVDLVIAWANRAVEHGLETPTLALLAGLGRDPNAFEVDDLFERTLTELGLVPQSPQSRRRAYSALLCAGIVDGTLHPRAALAELLQQWEGEHDGDLAFAFELSDEIERLAHDDVRLFYPALTRENVVETIRSEARAWLSRHGSG